MGYNTYKGGSSSGGPMRGNFNSNRSAPYNTSGKRILRKNVVFFKK